MEKIGNYQNLYMYRLVTIVWLHDQSFDLCKVAVLFYIKVQVCILYTVYFVMIKMGFTTTTKEYQLS